MNKKTTKTVLAQLYIMTIFLLCCVFLTTTTKNPKITVDQANSFLTDQYGRYIFYKGINVVYKQFPYYPPSKQFTPQESLVQQDFQNLKAWGFNCIRLYIAWQGFQPQKGKYNYTYLQQLNRINHQAQSYGIKIILDAHHDLYSKKYCGQGFPTWATPVYNFPYPFKTKFRYDQQGNPLKQDCMKNPFWQYYITQDVNRFQHQFFTNKYGLLDNFISMWIAVASYFKSQDNVIGYEILNQPIGGNGYQNFYDVMGPGVGNNKYLMPFYKKMSKQLRKIDQQKLFIFQPSMVDEFGSFYTTPSEQKYHNLDVLSYHTYCPLLTKHAQPANEKVCGLMNSQYISHRVKNIKKLKIGGMMTQFGDVLQTDKGVRQVSRNIKYAENNWQSWFYWQYKRNNDSTSLTNSPWQESLYYPNGTVQWKKVKVLSHPYVYALCGVPIKSEYLDRSWNLQFFGGKCYNEDRSETKHSEIFINEDLYYKGGFKVVFNNECQECRLRWISKSYYEIVIGQNMRGKTIKLSVIGYI